MASLPTLLEKNSITSKLITSKRNNQDMISFSIREIKNYIRPKCMSNLSKFKRFILKIKRS